MKTFKKLGMITYPTPLQEMHNLRKALNAKPRLFVKRDDLTEIGLGGNKNRKLDYLMAEAKGLGCDTVITWGGPQSNHSRQTLAYAALLGMECHILINDHPSADYQGNLLIYKIFDAKLHYEPDTDNCPAYCEELAARLTAEGKRVYSIPVGGSNPLGTVGYVDCAKELVDQMRDMGVTPDHVFCTSGSAGTHAGLAIGMELYAPNTTLHGVAISRKQDLQVPRVVQCANETAAYMGLKLAFIDEDICLHDGYFGEGYAKATQGGIDAIKLLAQTQAVLLDPIYTAKAMAGMLDQLTSGALDDAAAVVFVHTGGFPATFNYSECF